MCGKSVNKKNIGYIVAYIVAYFICLLVTGTVCGQYCEPNTWEEVTFNQLYTQYLYTLSRNCKWYRGKKHKKWWISKFTIMTYWKVVTNIDEINHGLTSAQILPANFSNAMAARHAKDGQIHNLEWPWHLSW